VKVIAYDKFKSGVTLGTLRPYLRDEVSNVWRLWKAGIVRENYARAEMPGVVIVFECASLDEVKRHIAEFPLTRAGLIEWDFIALDCRCRWNFSLTSPSMLPSRSTGRRSGMNNETQSWLGHTDDTA
jgi:hypothetical protein